MQKLVMHANTSVPFGSLNYSPLGTSASRLFECHLKIANGLNECFVKRYSSFAPVVSVLHIHVNSF